LPLPQIISFVAQYLSQPQQMRSGCAGRTGLRRTITLCRQRSYAGYYRMGRHLSIKGKLRLALNLTGV
jgi:hypothetical protein